MKHRVSRVTSAAVILFAVFCQVSCTVRAGASGGKQALFEKASEDLDKELLAAKTDGLPQSDQELFGPAPKPADNAAPVYAAALAEMGKQWRSYVILQRLKGPPGSPAWKDAATSLPLVINALNKAQAASSLPQCWTGADANFATRTKQLGKVLCAKARLQISIGKRTEAMQSLQAAWKIADHAAMEPTMSGFINSVGIKRTVCRTAESIITDTKADRSMLLDLQSTFQMLTSEPNARRAFQGVYVFFWSVYQPTLDGEGVRENLEDVNDRGIFVPGVDNKTLIRGYVTRGIQLCRNIDSVFANPKLSSRERSLEIFRLYQDQWKQDDTYRLSRDTLENADVALMLPMVETWRKLLLNGISILLADHLGHVPPSTIKDSDPYAGKAFGYIVTSNGFKLSSEGVHAINPQIPDYMVPPSSHVFSYPCNL